MTSLRDRLRRRFLQLRVRGTAVIDERGNPRPVYHGTTRTFTGFETGAQDAEVLHGAGFYFTEDAAVARGYAIARRIPPIHLFAAEEELDAFVAGHPDWQLVYRDEQGGQILGEFNTPEHRPSVVSAYLRIRRPLDLDAASEAALADSLPAIGARPPQTNAALLERLRLHAIDGGADDAQAQRVARDVVVEHGYDGLTQVDTREAQHHRVWIAFDPSQIVELGREAVNPMDE